MHYINKRFHHSKTSNTATSYSFTLSGSVAPFSLHTNGSISKSVSQLQNSTPSRRLTVTTSVLAHIQHHSPPNLRLSRCILTKLQNANQRKWQPAKPMVRKVHTRLPMTGWFGEHGASAATRGEAII